MTRSCRRLLYFLGLLVVFTEVFTTQADQLCILGEVPEQTVWLNGTLTVVFNATEGCKVITLFRDGEVVTYSQRPTVNGVHTIDVPSITEQFNNATMTLQGRYDFVLLNSTEFKVYTVDNVSAINNFTHSSNCTHTISCWDPPFSYGLEVTDYWYELRLNGGIVESDVTTDLCVVFNLTTLPANEPGYSLSVWARAPPGNGTVTNTSIAAATTPNVSYSTDVAVESQGAIFILVGEVNPSCPMSYPTDVTVSFSCVPSSSVRRVRIASNGSIEEIHSDDIETGHIGCIVPVTTSNLSGKNISEIFSFNSTDVQLLDAKPSELTTGAIDLWMKLARNSSLQVIVVNVTNSRGILVYSMTIERSLHQREVTHTTDVLPVEQYTISVLSCYNMSLVRSEMVNITRSNYSTPSLTHSPSLSVSPSTTIAVPSPTRTSTPTTNNTITIIVAVVVSVVVAIILAVIVILILVLYRRRRQVCCKACFGDEQDGDNKVHLPLSPVRNGAVVAERSSSPSLSTPPPASASIVAPSTNTAASIDTTATDTPPIVSPTSVAEPTYTTAPKDTIATITVSTSTGTESTDSPATSPPLPTSAAVAAKPSEHDQFTAEPTKGAVQATQLEEVPTFLSNTGDLTKQQPLPSGASPAVPIQQEATTSADKDKLLAVRSVPPAPSSMSEMVTTTQPTTDITTENSTVGSETALIDTSPPAAAHKPIGVRALAAVRKKMPTLFTARATETQQPIQETTTASFDSERPLLSQKEPSSPSSPSSYDAVKSEEKELYQAEPEEETSI